MTATVTPLIPARRNPAQAVTANACAASEHLERIAAANVRLAFAWQRMWLRGAIAVAAALTLSGCGYNTAVIRIVEYSGGGVVAPITGEAAGIAVHQAGAEHAFAEVTVIYQGERAAVRVSAGEGAR